MRPIILTEDCKKFVCSLRNKNKTIICQLTARLRNRTRIPYNSLFVPHCSHLLSFPKKNFDLCVHCSLAFPYSVAISIDIGKKHID